MRATWTTEAGLQIHGEHHGQKRFWTVKAWAALADGTREQIVVRPKTKCTLRDLTTLINAELCKFEVEMGEPTTRAGFEAIAR